MDHGNPWTFLPIGYLATVLIEAPVLLLGLSRRHAWPQRLAAGCWLTACTYPAVALVLPALMLPHLPRWSYIATAEVFAPLAECALFWAALVRSQPPDARATTRDYASIVAANLLSFAAGEAMAYYDGWKWLLERSN